MRTWQWLTSRKTFNLRMRIAASTTGASLLASFAEGETEGGRPLHGWLLAGGIATLLIMGGALLLGVASMIQAYRRNW